MGDFKVHQVRFFEFVPWSVQCMAYNKDLNKLAVSRMVRPEIASEQELGDDMMEIGSEDVPVGSIEIWNIDDNWFQERVFSPVSSVESLLWCGERLFSGGIDGFLHEHDLQTGTIKGSASSNNNAIWCLTMNNSHTLIAAGTEGGSVVLFEVFTDGFQYYRAFSNLGERILSIAWHEAENVIVTGGIDNIRIWSVHSGQAISRLDPGRMTSNLATFVYCLTVTDDFTIISGDSRGYTCFWEGHHGTLIKSFRAHQGPVFAMCMFAGGRRVLTSGADPTMIQFDLTPSQDSETPNHSWVMSTSRVKQSHDVRSLVCTGNFIISAGIDGRLLVFNVAGNRMFGSSLWIVSPIPQQPLVHTAGKADSILLQFPHKLELWRLGSTTHLGTGKPGEELPVESVPSCTVSLSLRDGHFSKCSAVSPCGCWIACSDQKSLRLFRLSSPTKDDVSDDGSDANQISLTRVRCLPGGGAIVADCLEFTPDSSRLIVASNQGKVEIWELDDALDTSLAKVLDSPPSGSQPVLSLAVSPSGDYLAVCDLGRHIHVYCLTNLKYLCTLPTRSCHASAVAFHPSKPLIFAAYTDYMLMEFDISELEYTEWSRKIGEHLPWTWTQRFNKIRRVFYHPRQTDKIYLYDDAMLCIINKTQTLPDKSTHIFGRSSFGKRKRHVKHCLHVCEKFRYVMHVDVLNDDSLVVVERPPIAVKRSLPPPLHRKKFGI